MDNPPRILQHEVRMCPVTDLVPHPKNARKHAAAILDESIAENGIYKPVLASTASGFILAGHGVLERAKVAGLAEIPVYWIDGLTPADELKILAADNRASDLSPGYDELALAELLQSVQSEGDGFQGTGFTQQGFDELIESAAKAILDDAKRKAREVRELAGPDVNAPQLEGMEFRVVVDCKDEKHQTELLERFETEGLACRALIS